MALYITLTNGREALWYVTSLRPDIQIEDVAAVQADGDELEHIKANFVNLPYPNKKRVVEWYGDLAKLIVRHLG